VIALCTKFTEFSVKFWNATPCRLLRYSNQLVLTKSSQF